MLIDHCHCQNKTCFTFPLNHTLWCKRLSTTQQSSCGFCFRFCKGLIISSEKQMWQFLLQFFKLSRGSILSSNYGNCIIRTVDIKKKVMIHDHFQNSLICFSCFSLLLSVPFMKTLELLYQRCLCLSQVKKISFLLLFCYMFILYMSDLLYCSWGWALWEESKTFAYIAIYNCNKKTALCKGLQEAVNKLLI